MAWEKTETTKDGRVIYTQNTNGVLQKKDYYPNGDMIYYENGKSILSSNTSTGEYTVFHNSDIYGTKESMRQNVVDNQTYTETTLSSVTVQNPATDTGVTTGGGGGSNQTYEDLASKYGIGSPSYSGTSYTTETTKSYDAGDLGSPSSLSKGVFQNPNSDTLVYNWDTNKLVWIKMVATPVYKLTQNVRAQDAFTTRADSKKSSGTSTSLAVTLDDAKTYTFKFLASEELIETVSHEWKEYESMAQGIQQAYANWGISTWEQIKGALSAMGVKNADSVKIAELPTLLGGMFKAKTEGMSGGDLAKSVYSAVKGVAKSGYVANYRVDSPLQYSGSPRREFELIFNLVNTIPGKNHAEVVLPVKMLEMLSSPSYGEKPDEGFNVEIILPYVFSVNTDPGNLITCDMAVLKQVQPTWKGPWYKGYPSRCELRLSFMEYRPLEQRVFYGYKESVIQTAQKERAKAVSSIEKEGTTASSNQTSEQSSLQTYLDSRELIGTN